MSETAFTPGPWRIDEDCSDELVIVGPRPNAKRFGVRGEWDIAKLDLDRTDGEPEGESEANARLIASAPEMFDVLHAIGYWPSVRAAIGDKLCAQLDAALRKARGDQ